MLLDMMKLSFKNLGRKKSRSFLTILGIGIGVASVVLISSIGDIGTYAIHQEIDHFGVAGVMVSGNSNVAGTQLDERHLTAIRQSAAVENAAPIVVNFTKSYMRELMLDAVVWGLDANAQDIIVMDKLYGRLLTKNDVQAGRKVCVIDQNIAQAYYKRDNVVGKMLSLQLAGQVESFEVVGVVASGGALMQGLMGDIIPSFIYTPYTTMQMLSGKETFDQIAVSIKEGVSEDVAGMQLVSICNGISGVKTGFKAENMQSQTDKLDSILGIITVVLSAIAGISMVVAGLSIMTVMLVSVGERTREIGIKKSIGASRQHILCEFMVEALLISVIGSIFGTLVGLLLLAIGCLPFGIPLRVNLIFIVLCTLFSVVVGVLFGVYPASVASRLRPVDALRCE